MDRQVNKIIAWFIHENNYSYLPSVRADSGGNHRGLPVRLMPFPSRRVIEITWHGHLARVIVRHGVERLSPTGIGVVQ
ncbi:MAG TPA: hypothetical protein PLS55_01355 [Thermogutta sp.]|nr:hypothetical protein [Thermogutta sp.]